jgi:hypothetical protein
LSQVNIPNGKRTQDILFVIMTKYDGPPLP